MILITLITVINYLKTGAGSDNPYCQNLAPLRDISIKNPKDYVEELEFSLTCYKSRYIVADLFLKIMISIIYFNLITLIIVF